MNLMTKTLLLSLDINTMRSCIGFVIQNYIIYQVHYQV